VQDIAGAESVGRIGDRCDLDGALPTVLGEHDRVRAPRHCGVFGPNRTKMIDQRCGVALEAGWREGRGADRNIGQWQELVVDRLPPAGIEDDRPSRRVARQSRRPSAVPGRVATRGDRGVGKWPGDRRWIAGTDPGPAARGACRLVSGGGSVPGMASR
jgi:hypothetical protein